MGKLEQTLKTEIARLARKEIRATCLPLAREVRRLKRTVSALRKTVTSLAHIGSQLRAQRTAERAKMEAAPEEVKAARLSPGLIRKLRKHMAITQGELATLAGVSTSAVCSWEYGKARPEGRNREALVALRKLGRRDVRRLLAAKAAEPPPKSRGRPRGRGKQR